MDRLVFGMHHLNVTQIGTLIDGKTHYSHPNFALDLAGEDSGVDFWFNKEQETCFYCSGSFGSRSTGNTRFFVSCDASGKQKKVMCADGKERVVTLAMTHSNVDYQLYHIYRYNEVMYREGDAGRATGMHIHLEVAEGSQKTKYWDANLHVWRMKNEFNPVNAFFILEGYTTVIDTKGLAFKMCTETKVEEKAMTDAEKLVNYAKTQIGNGGKEYWNYFGYKDEWCSEFVSYCGWKCGFVPKLMPKADTCKKAIEFYKSKNEIHLKNGYTPKSGDIIFFGKDGTDHTAIVEKVDGVDITVIEGNAGDTDYLKSRVCRTVYKKNNAWIWGYSSPFEGIKPKQVDLSDKLKKEPNKWVNGGIAGESGTLFKVPKRSTLKLSIFHNATYKANSEWHVTTASLKAFKMSQGESIVSVTVVDEEHVLVRSESGNPRTYWLMLE